MDKEELTKLTNTIAQINSNINILNAINKIEAQFKAYIEIVEPVKECRSGSPDKLRSIVTKLKQQGGEEWAVGEMLERTLNLFSALDYENGKYIGNGEKENTHVTELTIANNTLKTFKEMYWGRDRD